MTLTDTGLRLTDEVVRAPSADLAGQAAGDDRCSRAGMLNEGQGGIQAVHGTPMANALPLLVVPAGEDGRVVDVVQTSHATLAGTARYGSGSASPSADQIDALTDGPGQGTQGTLNMPAGSVSSLAEDEAGRRCPDARATSAGLILPDHGPGHRFNASHTACAGSVPSDHGPGQGVYDTRQPLAWTEEGDTGGDRHSDGDRLAPVSPTSPIPANGRSGHSSRGAHRITAAPATDPIASDRVDGVEVAPLCPGDRTPSADLDGVHVAEEGDGADHRRPDDRGATVGPVALPTDDLDVLHAALGHYARELLDVQKLRIAQGNRVAAMERDGLPDGLIAFARDTHDVLTKKERQVNAYLAKQARRHPMAPWVEQQRGIGLAGFARLLGLVGRLDRFATVSKLWAYLGMHTVDGLSPRKRKGERANWSHEGRVLCCQVGESIVKVGKGGEYREAYDRKKADYVERRPEWTPAHRHAAARRYAVKLLLRRAWIEWRRCQREAAA